MTGVLARLRAWLGSLFGDSDGDADDADADDGADTTDGQRVVHRDDRPLETPAALSADPDHTLAPSSPSGPTADDDDRPPVDIPDAESDAATVADADTATDDAGSDGDSAFVCSVCGTGVDAPDANCPLCHSADVVPAGERTDDAPSVRGRTAVSEADDEAVDRLRDVRGGGE